MAARFAKARRALYALVALGLLVGAAAIALPMYVKHLAIAAAEKHGVHLTIDHVELGWSEVRFTGLAGTTPDLPGIRVTLEEARVERSGLSAERVVGSGLDLTLEGPTSELLQALSRVHRPPTAATAMLPPIQIASGRVLWTKPFGDTSSLEATALQVTFPAAAELGDEFHGTLGRVVAALAPGKELGPWSARLDRTPNETSLRVELVPGEPGAATIVRSVIPFADGTTGGRFEVNVHGQPLSHVGVPGALLGIPAGTDPNVELSFRHARTAPDKVDGALQLNLRGARFVSMSIPADVRLDVAWDGDPKGPVPVRRGAFNVGPFAGNVAGTVQPLDGGFRTDLTLQSQPVPCSTLAGAQAVDSAGALGALAEAAGLTHVVSGEATLEGKLLLDTTAPEKTRVELAPKSNCSLSFLR